MNVIMFKAVKLWQVDQHKINRNNPNRLTGFDFETCERCDYQKGSWGNLSNC